MKQMTPQMARQLADQVGLQIGKAVSDGMNEFTIRLNPAELGRVTVKLNFGDDGTLRASVMTDRPETLQMLQQDSRSLERALGESDSRGR